MITFLAFNRLTGSPYATSSGMSFVWPRLIAFVIYCIFRFWKGGRFYPADVPLILLIAGFGIESLPLVFFLYLVFRKAGWIRQENLGGTFWQRVNSFKEKLGEEDKCPSDEGKQENSSESETENKGG